MACCMMNDDVYIYIYIHIYIYVHTWISYLYDIYICITKCIYTYLYILYMFACIWLVVRWMRARPRSPIYIHIWIYDLHMFVHIYIFINMCVYICMYLASCKMNNAETHACVITKDAYAYTHSHTNFQK